MGFTTGFTGGVTLTLGVAYLTLLAHQRNREQQAAILRQQTYLLSGVVDPLPPVLPPTRLEQAVAERAHFTEVAKDRWNAEIEHAVRWAQTKDWSEVREGVETAISRLWARGIGQAQEGIEKGEEKSTAVARDLSSKANAEAREKNDGVAAAAKSAYADAKARSVDLANKAEKKAEEKASEAKGSVFGAIGRGIEKGKEVFSKTKSAVVAVEEKVDPTVSPVEKALQQRYEQPGGLDQSVEELLAARYVPIDQKDNTDLKAL
ncbi:hypothetical protein F5B22DRAFT_610737 [Xylaria bambusicola]|uniref:uncharacterized protein n=1 Tax=Xylaria bambusicola TaxID=326684 RepID=UPI0020082F61|nr:uncharacterized protein F5B22DRAFT_610737 [Xylaria bambusicola]KAI0514502.1 hypothetical protein F5B22DRAFT_610737 [Xylaria bambusicola]